MPFAQATKTYSDTRKRTSSSYVKFDPEYRVVLRILNPEARLVWKHWVSEANEGRGMGAICPNTSANVGGCPIEASLKDLPKDDPKRLEKRAKKRYIANVLDRTPYTTCSSCNERTPGKKCQSCGSDLKKNTFEPLNEVKILEGGPRLFFETLNGVEKLQTEELGLEITDYDIIFQTQGIGRDRKISAIPQAASELTEQDLADKETGEPQPLFDLDLLAEPASIEEIELMLQGATMQQLNELRGIA